MDGMHGMHGLHGMYVVYIYDICHYTVMQYNGMQQNVVQCLFMLMFWIRRDDKKLFSSVLRRWIPSSRRLNWALEAERSRSWHEAVFSGSCFSMAAFAHIYI